MNKFDNVPVPDDPSFVELGIVDFQKSIKEHISWLNYSFGMAQKLVTKKEGRDYFYPGVHIGRGNYVSVLPDQNLGNFCFFVVEDPVEIKNEDRNTIAVKAKVSLVLWFNLSKVFPGVNDRGVEAIKQQVLSFIAKDLFSKTMRFTPTKVYDRAENIYRGYSLQEVETQYVMQPFGGIRIEGEMIMRIKDC